MKSSGYRERRNEIYFVCLFLILLASTFLRLGGIPYSEPFMINVDEPNFVLRALRILKTGDINPHWFGHPGTLTIYCLSLIYSIKAVISEIPLNELLIRYKEDPAPFHYLGKYLIVFWSMIGQLALWALARAFVSRWYALFAVAAFAVAPLDIEYATLIRTDTQQSALLIVLCLFLVQIVRKGSWPSFLGAGAILGLAVAVKWPSVLGSLSIALASALHFGMSIDGLKAQSSKLLGAAVMSLVLCFASGPHIFLDFGTVLKNVATESRTYHLGATSAGFIPATLSYLELLILNLSVPVFVMAVIGSVYSLRAPFWREYAAVSSLFGFYLLFISMQYLWWQRWAVPLIPFVAFSAAIGLAYLFDAACHHIKRFEKWLIVLLVVVLGLVLSANAIGVLATRSGDDDGVTATRWIAENIPTGARVLTEYQGPYLPRNRFDVYVVARSGKIERAAQKSRYYVPKGLINNVDLRIFNVNRFEYIITGGFEGRLRGESDRYKAELEKYDYVYSKTTLLKIIGQYSIRKVEKP